jgi:hypothetical protein
MYTWLPENITYVSRIDSLEALRGVSLSRQVNAAPASEDFGSFGTSWGIPSMFWFISGPDPAEYAKAKTAGDINKIPTNHSPQFTPVLHPTPEAGVEAMIVAALAWLAQAAQPR